LQNVEGSGLIVLNEKNNICMLLIFFNKEKKIYGVDLVNLRIKKKLND
jgi:hypothetical protein